MAYSHDITTKEGRLLQLKTWASGRFSHDSLREDFIYAARAEFEGKSFANLAEESESGLKRVEAYLRKTRSAHAPKSEL